MKTKEEKATYQRAWRLAHMEHVKRYEKAYCENHGEMRKIAGRKNYNNLRVAMLHAYGNKCACCGETEQAFLTLDHIFEDGAEERQLVHGGRRAGSPKFYRLLRTRGWPTDRYQLLCYNCNSAKTHGGCPHQKNKVEAA